VLQGLWKGLKVDSKSFAAIVDMLPYDHTLPRAIIEFKTMNMADVPQMCCGNMLWVGAPEDKALIRQILFREVRDVIYKAVKEGRCRIATLADIPQESEVPQESKPTFREDNFKLTHPMEDDTLPVLQSVQQSCLHMIMGLNEDVCPTQLVTTCAGLRHVGGPWRLLRDFQRHHEGAR